MRRPDPVAPALRTPFTYREGLATGEGAGRLAGPAYRRLGRGLLVPAGAVLSHSERASGFLSILPAGTVLAGVSAASALGVPWIDADLPVEVVLPPRGTARSRPGLTVRRDQLRPGETVPTRWGRATGGARTAFDLGRGAGECGRVVAAVDAVLRASGASVDDVREVLVAHPGVRGVRRLSRVLDLADPRAESPPESVLRVLIVLAGLPAPVPQFEVRLPPGSARPRARLDLAWPQLKLAVEYDGAVHRDPRTHSQDLARHNALRALGWTVIQVDSPHLNNPHPLLATLSALITR